MYYCCASCYIASKSFLYNREMSWQQINGDINGLTKGGSPYLSISLSADGTIVAVGYPGDNGSTGAAAVYQYNGVSWVQLGSTLYGTGGIAYFGSRVSLSSNGTILAVSAPGGFGIGYVNVYSYSGGSWNLLGASISSGSPDSFGTGLSLSGDGLNVAVGGPFANASVGQVRVYRFTGGNWNLLGSFINGSGPGAQLGFGVSLSSNGTYLAVNESATNSAFVYHYNGSAWVQHGQTLTGCVGDLSVSISGNGQRVAVGDGSGDGIIRIYDYFGGAWNQVGSSINGGIGTGDQLGALLQLSSDGSTVISYKDSIKGVVIYKYTTNWNLYGGLISSPDTLVYQYGFGNAISSDGTKVALLNWNMNTDALFAQVYQNSGGGGGAGDPYVTTLEGVRYKLPIMDGVVRFYQGPVSGKVLTINAQLRTMENDDLAAENLRSYNDLKSKMPAYKLKEIEKSIFSTVKLAFFEKFYINYDGVELTIDVWDHKFKIDSYTGGRIPSSIVNGSELTGKYTGVYKDYKSQTLKFNVGNSASLYISVYPAKLMKNGIFFEGPSMDSGNGVIVNTLSQKDMTLACLTDLTPVPKRNTRPKEKEEWFLDKDGYRTKKILRAA